MTPKRFVSRRHRRAEKAPSAPGPVSVFASDVLCHLRVAELLERLGFRRRDRESVADGAMSCESLLARLRRLGRRQRGRAPASEPASED